MKKIIALLPMKANSERIPNKNLKNFAGKPLFFWTLKNLVNCKQISYVIINTDSEEISNAAKQFFPDKVKINWRPKSICGDFVSMNEIINFDIETFTADYYLQTHSTNPLLKTSTIEKALDLIDINLKSDYDSIFSVNKIQSRFYDVNCQPINHDPKDLVRTQDLNPIFEENSCFYIFSKQSFLNSEKKRIGCNPLMFPISKLESIDIDDKEDFLIAESFFKLLRNYE